MLFRSEMKKRMWEAKQQQIEHECNLAYKWAIENGLAKEVARSVLPEGLVLTRLYMKGSLRSWFHYIQLRTDSSTQKEHREVANECARIIIELFPMIRTILEESENE